MNEVKKMFSCAELAARRFLWESPEALEYLRDQRGLSDETILRWNIGFWKPYDAMKVMDQLGIDRSLMSLAYIDDRISGRIVIPLKDPSGTTIGFVGRKLPSDEHPVRYLYPSKSIFFDQRSYVMGIYQLRLWGAVVPIPVEGPLDLIVGHQWGFPTVCTLRSSFTREQALMIRALNQESCVFLPDADQWDETKEVYQSYLKSIKKWRKDLPEKVALAQLDNSDPADLLKTDEGRRKVKEAIEKAGSVD